MATLREDSFELHIPKRMQSANSASTLIGSLTDGEHGGSGYPCFRQGDLVRVPPGRYYVTQRSKGTPNVTVKLKVHTRGRVISIAATRSQRQQPDRTALLDPREFIGAEHCMCYRLLLNSTEHPAVDFMFVPEAKLKPWRDCICLAYASQPCPRCRQAFYCSQHCQQKHWDAEHRYTCAAPRATLRPLGCNPLPLKSHSSSVSDPGTLREDSTCNPLAHMGRSMRVAPHSEIVPEEEATQEPLFTMHSTGNQFRQLQPPLASPSASPRHSKWRFWKRV